MSRRCLRDAVLGWRVVRTAVCCRVRACVCWFGCGVVRGDVGWRCGSDATALQLHSTGIQAMIGYACAHTIHPPARAPATGRANTRCPTARAGTQSCSKVTSGRPSQPAAEATARARVRTACCSTPPPRPFWFRDVFCRRASCCLPMPRHACSLAGRPTQSWTQPCRGTRVPRTSLPPSGNRLCRWNATDSIGGTRRRCQRVQRAVQGHHP